MHAYHAENVSNRNKAHVLQKKKKNIMLLPTYVKEENLVRTIQTFEGELTCKLKCLIVLLV